MIRTRDRDWRHGSGALVAGATAVLIGAVVATGVWAQAATSEPSAPDPAACLNEQEAAVLRLINDYRADNGLPELKVSAALNRAAYLHSVDMAENNYVATDSPDGRTPQARMAEQGYSHDTTGENIAAGQATAQEVFDTWRESEEYHDALLNEDFRAIGIGFISNYSYDNSSEESDEGSEGSDESVEDSAESDENSEEDSEEGSDGESEEDSDEGDSEDSDEGDGEESDSDSDEDSDGDSEDSDSENSTEDEDNTGDANDEDSTAGSEQGAYWTVDFGGKADASPDCGATPEPPSDTPSPTGTSDPTSAPGDCEYPADVLDLTSWKLTLPVSEDGDDGDPREIFQPELATFAMDPWFLATQECDGVRFRSPVNGATTGNSSYPRSELREMNGDDEAGWSADEGTHTMTLTESFDHLPNDKQHLVGAQIHGGDDDVIVFRLEGNSLWLTNGDDTHHKLVTDNYQLGTKFEAKFVASDGEVKAYYNGELQTTLQADFSEGYFKAGAYTQANCENSAPCSEDNYGETTIYSISIEHS